MTKRNRNRSISKLEARSSPARRSLGAGGKLSFAFFGTSRVAVGILNELEQAGFVPALIVTAQDAPQGRGLQLTPPPVKEWALAHNIETHQPEKLNSNVLENLGIGRDVFDVFVVVDYGKILPKSILDIPKRGCLNVHFSLLPRYRGASPIRSAILADDRNIGTSIILLAEKLDEGPIVAQKPIYPPHWPMRARELEGLFVRESGRLLAQVLPEWVAGNIEAREQNHDLATYCEKIKKEDGLVDLNADPYKNLLKLYAYEGWPGTYAFFERGPSTIRQAHGGEQSRTTGSGQAKKIRVQILDAHLENQKLVIDRVKPEGKREMDYVEFLRSGAVLVAH